MQYPNEHFKLYRRISAILRLALGVLRLIMMLRFIL